MSKNLIASLLFLLVFSTVFGRELVLNSTTGNAAFQSRQANQTFAANYFNGSASRQYFPFSFQALFSPNVVPFAPGFLTSEAGSLLTIANNRLVQLEKRVFTPGTYYLETPEITGTLILDAAGNKNARFAFVTSGDLVFKDKAQIKLKGKAQTKNITWQAYGNISIGEKAVINGNLFAGGKITETGKAQLQGTKYENLTQKNARKQHKLLSVGPDLGLTKTAPQIQYAYNDLVTYTLRVENFGTTTETGATVTDKLLPTLQFVSATPSAGTYNPANGIWNLPVMAPGDTAKLTIVARIIAGGGILNFAILDLNGVTDVNFGNNIASTAFCARPPEPGNITGPVKFCIGDTGTFSVQAANLVSFNWTVPPTWTIVSGQGTSSINILSGTDTLTSFIYVQANTTCGISGLDSVKVTTVKPLDSLSVITGDTVVCENSVGNVYSIIKDPNVENYTWSVPPGWQILGPATGDSIVVSAGPLAGDISVFGTNFCGATATVTLHVRPTLLPLMPTTITPPFLGEPCVGQTGLIYTTDSISYATHYIWTVPAASGWVITSNDSSRSITVTAGTAGGNITVTGMNDCGISQFTFSLPVTLANQIPPQPPAIAGDPFPCLSLAAPFTYSIPPQGGVSTYNWVVPAAWTIVSGDTTESISIDFGSILTPPDTIKVSVTNGCGQSVFSTFVITPQTGPPPALTALTASPAGAPCIGQTVTYTVPVVNGANGYNWSVPFGWNIISGQGTNTVQVTVGPNADSVSVAAFNTCGPGKNAAVFVSPLPAAPSAPVISGNTFPCVGTALVYNATAFPAGATYTWAVPSGWVINSGQGTPDLDVTPGAATGLVSVTATNNCGSATTDLPVEPVNGVPAALGPITGDTTVCPGQNGLSYSVAPVANASGYDWQLPGGWTITSGINTNSITVGNITTAGNVTVTATNGCGAGPASTLPVTLTNAPPAPANPITGNIIPCLGSVAVYTTTPVSGANIYTWTIPGNWSIVSGQGTLSITVNIGSNSGNITITPENGCGTGAFSNLIVTPSTNGIPLLGAISGSTVPCINQTGVTYSVPAVPGAINYTWNVPAGWVLTSGAGTNTIQATAGTTGGQLDVTVTNRCGTSLPSTLTVTPTPTAPDSSGTIKGPSILCVGKTYTFTTSVVGRAATYTWAVPTGSGTAWQIISGQGTNTVTVKAGVPTGTVRVTASNGCGAAPISSRAITLSDKAPALTGTLDGPLKICLRDDILTYKTTPATHANSYTWSVPPSWQILSGQGTNSITVKAGNSDGTIKVEATNDCGKSAPLSVAVIVRTVPVVTDKIKAEVLTCNTRRYSIPESADATDYYWTVPKGWVITNGQGSTAIEVITAPDTGTVAVKAQNDGCASIAAKRSVTSDIDLVIPNAFSPNNDGINETWGIDKLADYPDNELTIINRWGGEVFRQKNYKNTWTGKDLSAGTYYYILRVKLCNDVQQTFKGFLMIVR